jgi:hypothetical protein
MPYVSVEIDLDSMDTDDLVDELDVRGYDVYEKGDIKTFEKQIHDLKDDFINWYQFGMKNENFEKVMKQFFKDTIDEYIA